MRARALSALPLLALVGCSIGGGSPAEAQGTWMSTIPLTGAVDVAGPRGDNRLVLAGNRRLWLQGKSGIAPFAQGRGGYLASTGEPYITLTTATRLRKRRCSFHRDDVFALDTTRPGLTRISRRGRAGAFAALPAGSFPSGITFDRTGAFGHRILVTTTAADRTTVHAFDCRGRRKAISSGPRVEGGIEVAPRSFGRFAGWLIGPDEMSGRIVAFRRGRAAIVAESGLPAGPDIGVESMGFVPSNLGASGAYMADLGVPGGANPGTDSILRLDAAGLIATGVRAGDLLAATEAGARTIAVRCGTSCGVFGVANGPTATHGEGHIIFRREP